MVASTVLHQETEADNQRETTERDEAAIRIRVRILEKELENERQRRHVLEREAHSIRSKDVGISAAEDSYKRSAAEAQKQIVELRDQIRDVQYQHQDDICGFQDRIRDLEQHLEDHSIGAAESVVADSVPAAVGSRGEELAENRPIPVPCQQKKAHLDLEQENSELRKERSHLQEQNSNLGEENLWLHDEILRMRKVVQNLQRERHHVVNAVGKSSQTAFEAHKPPPTDLAPPSTLTNTSAVPPNNKKQRQVPLDGEKNPEDLKYAIEQDIQQIRNLDLEATECEDKFQGLIHTIPGLQVGIARLEDERRRLQQATQFGVPSQESKKRLERLKRTKDLRCDFNGLTRMVESLRDCKPVLKEHLRLLEKDLRGLEPVPRTQGPQLPAGYQTFDPTTIPHGLSEARRASECVEELLLGFKKEAPLLWYRISATALDLTGSIRTFCRVHREALGTRHPSVEVREPNQLKVKGRPTTNSGLDHVFGPGARGEEIVAELRPHIRILLDQTNVHLFCYGTSDSAQTQTLFGPKAQQEQGIVHLLLEDAYHLVHDIVNRYEQLGKLTMSSFNIERDKVRDCLNGQVLGSNARSLLQEVVVSDLEQGRKFLDQASANRQKHARPSTSHFGIRWTLGLDRSPADTVSFTIVDLANGGKKASGQDSSIDTVESKGVRGDLENLHLVINGLSRGDGATRVGDSTLTRFLEPTLSSPKMKAIKLVTVDEDADSTAIEVVLRFIRG